MLGLRITTRQTARRRRPAAFPGGPATDDGRRTAANRQERGFTLVELLVVIIVLAILMALLLPAIAGAMRNARNAAVSSEINQMAQAMAQFNSQYGGYPPSRVLLVENGNYTPFIGSNASISSLVPNLPPGSGWIPSGGTGDITVGQLATRSLSAFRKFWPKVQFSTNGSSPPNIANANGAYWYDFNGNGILDSAYILQGHECLVFFLGGIPLPNPIAYTDPSSATFGITGFGTDPTNPFTNSIAVDSRYANKANPMYNANRQSPLYQFNPGRLFADPSNPTTPGIPGYYDTLNSGPPQGIGGGANPINFFAYFSAYGNGNYDPNDVNFFETDGVSALPLELLFNVNFPTFGTTPTGSVYTATSPSPNPYTSTTTAATGSGTVTYQTPQTFQIISSGVDGQYGVGGQFVAPSQSATVPLPFDSTHTVNTSDGSIRRRESDNLTNFKSSTLQ